MPLDGASVLTSNLRTLAIAMLDCGIDPIEPLVLDPASWFHRHRVVQITVLALMLAGVTGSFAVGLLQARYRRRPGLHRSYAGDDAIRHFGARTCIMDGAGDHRPHVGPFGDQ
jgi:hypothetical protein